MSGGKSNGVGHQVLDRLAKFEALWSSKQAELVKKHNELAAQGAALEQIIKQVANFTASELGKYHGTISGHIATLGRTTSGLDLNVLALAEIVKELVGQLTQVDAIFRKAKDAGSNFTVDLTDDEVAQVKVDAEAWYKDLMASAFKTARENIEAQEAIAIAQEAEARAAAEKAATDQQESATVEKELKDASVSDRTSVAPTSGGPGSQFPEGADLFGG